MKAILTSALVTFALVGAAEAKTHQVKGYMRKDGTYVPPHMASNPDPYRYNNRSSQSNGGTKRDEFSNPAATNKRNSGYSSADNDGDGINNGSDSAPEDKDTPSG